MLFKNRVNTISGIAIMTAAVIAFIFIALGKGIDMADGLCSLVTAICVAVMATYVLRFVKAEIKSSK